MILILLELVMDGNLFVEVIRMMLVYGYIGFLFRLVIIMVDLE